MSYKFLKPKITNIWETTWETIKIQGQFWVFMILTVAFIILFIILDWPGIQIIIIPFVVAMILYLTLVQIKIRSSFWKQFAEINGWQYKNSAPAGLFGVGYSNSEKESGLMFKEGHTGLISNEIEGIIDNRSFRIFCYQFSTGYGKSRRTHYYTVFAFKFNGSFPHIYLNNKSNHWSINAGESISLPAEFKNKFFLSAPKEYEMEALEIFTPDVLVKLLDYGFPYDVEFVNQEMFVFDDGQVNKFEQLDIAFNKALELENLLDKKLDKFKFQPIGDMPVTLSKGLF